MEAKNKLTKILINVSFKLFRKMLRFIKGIKKEGNKK